MSDQGTSVTNVPFASLQRQYANIKADIDATVADVIENASFIRGPHVDKFEAAFAEAIGVKHCVSCANGTDAIYIAMVALGVKPGDEVIVPGMSWISTSETVTQAGGTVVFCDIDPVTNTMDPDALEAKITDRTVGIIPVHLYGHPADMTRIMKIADSRKLWVIEDCAQAHYAVVDGKQVGTMGVAATFSFYPGKNLGAMGDAGAVVTNDKALADHMAKYARHGGLRKGDHEIEGINSRLDGLQAAILNVKLPHLTEWTRLRQKWAAAYTEKLSNIDGLKIPTVADGCTSVWHLFVVQTDKRDALAAHLKAAGIQTSINYPRALPFLPCYSHMGHEHSEFPNAHRLAEQGLCLPIFPEMTESELDYVCATVSAFFDAQKADA